MVFPPVNTKFRITDDRCRSYSYIPAINVRFNPFCSSNACQLPTDVTWYIFRFSIIGIEKVNQLYCAVILVIRSFVLCFFMLFRDITYEQHACLAHIFILETSHLYKRKQKQGQRRNKIILTKHFIPIGKARFACPSSPKEGPKVYIIAQGTFLLALFLNS